MTKMLFGLCFLPHVKEHKTTVLQNTLPIKNTEHITLVCYLITRYSKGRAEIRKATTCRSSARCPPRADPRKLRPLFASDWPWPPRVIRQSSLIWTFPTPHFRAGERGGRILARRCLKISRSSPHKRWLRS